MTGLPGDAKRRGRTGGLPVSRMTGFPGNRNVGRRVAPAPDYRALPSNAAGRERSVLLRDPDKIKIPIRLVLKRDPASSPVVIYPW
jgi:hypothetical protein